MLLTQAEILQNLGLDKTAPVRIPYAIGQMGLSAHQLGVLFRNFAGDSAELPANHLIETVVTYLVYDAAKGLPLDVAGCIARTEKMAKLMPGSFTVSASDARAAARDAERAERLAKLGVDPNATPDAAPVKPYEVHNADGTISRKRGRPPAGVKSVYDQVKELYIAAVDKSKEAMLPLLQSQLGLVPGTAQTYWYKAKKELAS